MLTKLLKASGVSLVELTVSMGVLSLAGLGYMSLNQIQKKSSKGVEIVSELDQAIFTIRNVMSDPQVCELNFLGKPTGGTASLDELKGLDPTKPLMKVGAGVAKESYTVSSIVIGNHNPRSHRTTIEVKLLRKKDATRSQDMVRLFNVYTKTNAGGTITECVDPIDNTARGALYKMCLDADAGTPVTPDCEDNVARLMMDVKERMCNGNVYAFVKWDAASKKCVPIDSNLTCGAQYMRGYDVNGNAVCYNPASASANLSGYCECQVRSCDDVQLFATVGGPTDGLSCNAFSRSCSGSDTQKRSCTWIPN